MPYVRARDRRDAVHDARSCSHLFQPFVRDFIRLTDALWVVLHAMQAVTNADSYAAIYKTRPDVKVRGRAWCVRDGWGAG